jgi:hypothetical protein
MANWVELITTNNISQYLTSPSEVSVTYIHEDIDIGGAWLPVKICPYLDHSLSNGQNIPAIETQYSHFTAMAWGLGANNLTSCKWTKDPDTDFDYSNSSTTTTGKNSDILWTPAVSSDLNSTALSNPFSVDMNWRVSDAVISLSIPQQPADFGNAWLGGVSLFLSWGKFTYNPSETEPADGLPIQGNNLTDPVGLTTYTDLATNNKVILEGTQAGGNSVYKFTNFKENVGQMIWDFPDNMTGDPNGYSIGPIDITPSSTFVLGPNEKLIPIIFIKDDNNDTGTFDILTFVKYGVFEKYVRGLDIQLSINLSLTDSEVGA